MCVNLSNFLKKKVSDCWTETGVSPELDFICAEMYIQAQKGFIFIKTDNSMVMTEKQMNTEKPAAI